MNDLSELKKKNAYVSFIIFFGCLGPTLFLMAYPRYKLVGFVFFAICLFFCVVLFQARPSAEIKEPLIRTKEIEAEMDSVKEKANKLKDNLGKIIILIIVLPIIAALIYWTTNNIFFTDLFLSLALIVAGIYFGFYYYFTSLEKLYRKSEIENKEKINDLDR